MRFLSTLLFSLVLLQSSGLVRLADQLADGDGDCNEPCADRASEDGECPPTCPTCTCCHASRPNVAPTVSVELAPILVVDAVTFVEQFASPPSPPLRGIFHPPRT